MKACILSFGKKLLNVFKQKIKKVVVLKLYRLRPAARRAKIREEMMAEVLLSRNVNYLRPSVY